MSAQKPEIRLIHLAPNLIRQVLDRLDRLESRLANVESKQDRSDEVEHLANWYSPDGDPICNFTSRTYEEEES